MHIQNIDVDIRLLSIKCQVLQGVVEVFDNKNLKICLQCFSLSNRNLVLKTEFAATAFL
jgi:hypothetical protein